MTSLFMHMLVTFVWLFLSGNTSLGGFLVGAIAGFLVIALFRRALGAENYVRRVVALGRFGLIFLREVAISNFRIGLLALKPNVRRVHGEFMAYDVEDLTDLEILLLSYGICLSPGTAVAGKSDDKRLLILHVFGSGTPEEITENVDRTLRDPILAFTR